MKHKTQTLVNYEKTDIIVSKTPFLISTYNGHDIATLLTTFHKHIAYLNVNKYFLKQDRRIYNALILHALSTPLLFAAFTL